jgi:hypothetical protein|tara:strand:- start:463 stop:690 length:228 start_codon:yes stop_codon:yes gene_type:complete
MSEENKTDQANPEAEVMDVVSAIADNKRADAIDKLQDLLYARSSDAVDQYKKTVAATYFQEPPEETPDETDNGND